MLSLFLRKYSRRTIPRFFCQRLNEKVQEVKEQSQNIKEEEKLFEDEFKFEDQEEPSKNLYWLWIKRALKGLFYYTLATTLYASIKLSYFQNLNIGIFELEPFYTYGTNVHRWGSYAREFFIKPPVLNLLPPKMPIKIEMAKKTLVLNFEGTLYAKDFKAKDGIVILLRPGFNKFFQQISNQYEILLYSEEDTNFMVEVIQTIDPTGRLFPWFAGHEFMSWTSKGYRKDLKLVNRDPRKIVVVDFAKDIYLNNPENVLVLKKYEGEEEDNGLKDLALILNHLANSSVKDVRKEIQKLGGENAIKTFSENIYKKIEDTKNNRGFLFRKTKTLKN